MAYELVTKQAFLNQLQGLSPKVTAQVMEKVRFLCDDPEPDGDVKKKLHDVQGNIYRLRSGEYRILYTYGKGQGWVMLLGVDNRKDVYDHIGNLVAEAPSFGFGQLPDVADLLAPGIPAADAVIHAAPASASTPLTRRIEPDLLEQLRVPDVFWPALLACVTDDDLCRADVPDAIRNAVFDNVTMPNIERTLAQPDLLVQEVNDLLRYKEGELLGFLLRLSPEQERFVTYALNASGPTLVKGGPGTGKSMVAIYRVRALLAALRKAGNAQPRILFTTYTNALVAYTRQLLQPLLHDDVDYVEVTTYDKIIRAIYTAAHHGEPVMAKAEEQKRALARAIETAVYDGNLLQQKAQQTAIERLGEAYLLEELDTVITARQLDSLDAYLATPRPGRRVALNTTQRMAVWTVYQGYCAQLAAMGKATWQQLRDQAERAVRAGAWADRYDAIIVDEAQDLDPSVLRLLIGLCREPNRFFLTADANQSIYGAGFTWSDVHADLKFKGRTGILRTNFRSTRQIGEAAASYLAGGELDTDDGPDDDATLTPQYIHEGPLPAVRTVSTGAEQCDLLARFLPDAARMFQLGRGSSAVLVPTTEAGRSIAGELTARGLKTSFMPSNALDLTSQDVKVLTLKSAKGLEFPIVALAGFLNSVYPRREAGIGDEEWEEILARERRTLYVGMTRAMRALLVCAPADGSSPLLTGFTAPTWNLGAMENS
jgi:superfamily I DNA/RNA helicase/mRNA-degrading endonuclease RelE of RelBE toxin-antitoxin system